MLGGYVAVLIFLFVGIAFCAVALTLARLIRPHRPDAEKLSTYECGLQPLSKSWYQFNIRFYIFALLFVIFDVETAFLYPWAVVFRRLGMAAVVEMIVFVAILAVGLAYAWRKGALEWE
jgi:NADH:ubiquinone oxidoreductase subunit 3 (subunit A)